MGVTRKQAYVAAGLFAAGVIILALVLNPDAASAAITAAFGLIGAVLTGLASLNGMG